MQLFSTADKAGITIYSTAVKQRTQEKQIT